MISFDYKPQGVCARNIHLDLSDDGNKVIGVEFTGGCDGNLKAISKLVEGAPADRVIEVLAGNTCGMKKTSCADQLTRAIEAARASRLCTRWGCRGRCHGACRMLEKNGYQR